MTQQDKSVRNKIIDESLEFYSANYDLAGEWYLEIGTDVVLKRQDGLHICRFCGCSDATVSFRKIAHALPESLGNKSLFSEYECDECNEKFGKTIENDFGNWSKPMRTLMRINGKSGVPTMRKGPNGGWRIEYKNDRLEIKAYESDPIFKLDEENRKITFTLRRDAYTPVAVLKTFWKIALTVMSEQDVAEYAHALAWLQVPYAPSPAAEIPVFRTFVPGPIPNDKIAIQLLRRKRVDTAVPYMFLILMYGNEMFQVFLPSVARDAHLEGKTGTIPFYVTPYDLFGDWPYGQSQREPVRFSSADVVRGESVTLTMAFDGMEGIDTE